MRGIPGGDAKYIGYAVAAAIVLAVVMSASPYCRTDGVEGLLAKGARPQHASPMENISDSKLAQARVDAAGGESVAFFKAPRA